MTNNSDSETTAAAERLAEIDRLAKADADDLAKMRDGTKLTRYGLVEIIAYQQQEIADLKAQAAALADQTPLTQDIVNRVFGGKYVHPAESYFEIGLNNWIWVDAKAGIVTAGMPQWPKTRVVIANDIKTVGRFRHLLSALAIATPGKSQ